MDLSHGVGFDIETVHEIFFDTLFAMIAGMADGDVLSLSNVGQHLEGDDRLLVFRGVTARWNNGNRVLAKKRLSEDEISCLGNGEALGEGTHIGSTMEEFAELKTTPA